MGRIADDDGHDCHALWGNLQFPPDIGFGKQRPGKSNRARAQLQIACGQHEVFGRQAAVPIGMFAKRSGAYHNQSARIVEDVEFGTCNERVQFRMATNTTALPGRKALPMITGALRTSGWRKLR